VSTVADVIRAIDEEGSSSWRIADELAALEEDLTLKQIAERIWDERGVEWHPAQLGQYRATALAFPIDSRESLPTQTFSVAKELRAHPEKLLGWKPTKPGDVLTVERARALRGGGSSAAPKPDAWKAEAKRAFGVIARVAEHDPAFMIDMLQQTIAMIERSYPKALAKGRPDGLRAV
jgi:hypothetical protein